MQEMPEPESVEPELEPEFLHIHALLRSCCPRSAPAQLRARIVAEVRFVALTWEQHGDLDEGTPCA